MKDAHMNPADTVQAFIDLETSKMIGIHFGTFKLTDEGYSEPQLFLKEEIKKNSLNEKLFIIPKFGSAITF
jgi:L-ascorbate metabolism protein UlaG (beta-lactamase superfamily)